MKRILCVCLTVILLSGLFIPTASAENFSTTPMIAAAVTHTAVLSSDGTVWTWGATRSGRLGNGDSEWFGYSVYPVQVRNLNNVTAISAGHAHTLALRSDGTVWAWGNNDWGQLGTGNTRGSAVPVRVANLSGITAISAGSTHNLALRNDGTVWAWGENILGAVGIQSPLDNPQVNSPVQVPNLRDVTYVAAGHMFSMVIRSDGTVWGWGGNHTGQLGDGTTTDRHYPMQVQNLTNVKAVAAGGRHPWMGGAHTLAILNHGALRTWGGNEAGQLGDGTITNQHTPMIRTFGFHDYVAISAGDRHSAGIRCGGYPEVWGYNHSGQLGIGTTRSHAQETPVYNLREVVSISAGWNLHTAAVRADGTVWAWGGNEFGQLGNGTTNSSLVPVQVVGPNGVGFLNVGASEIPRLPAGPRPSPGTPFVDIAGHWAYYQIRGMYWQGLMIGTSATTFSPDAPLSRAMMVTILWRRAGEPPTSGNAPFADVAANTWYSQAVAWGYERGLFYGIQSNYFRPHTNITRELIVDMLFRYAADSGYNMAAQPGTAWEAFTDSNQISPWAVNSLIWANHHRILDGRTPTTIVPQGHATRAEVTVFIFRFAGAMFDLGQNEVPYVPTTQVPSGVLPFEWEVLVLTNRERANYGIAPLEWHGAAAAVARNHNLDMEGRSFFEHICPSGVNFDQRLLNAGISFLIAGENIGMGQLTPEDVVQRWMSSPGHRANILNPAFTHLGVGFHAGSTRVYPNIPPYFWTQKFLTIMD